MSRARGTFNISSNLEPHIKAPLDARQVVDTVAKLIDPSTWLDKNGNVWLYNGVIVGVANDDASLNGIYILLDAANYNLAGSWVQSSGGGGSSNITGENIGNGDASIFSEKTGNALRFRTLKGGDGVTIDVSDNIIIFDVSGGSVYNSTLNPTLTTPTTLGGYPSGTTVSSLLGFTFTKFVDNLLFPTVNPTYVVPFNSFSDNVASLQIINSSLTIICTATFNKGQILLNGVFQNNRSGLPVGYNYTDPSANKLLVDVSTASLSNIQIINGYKVLIGNQTWTNNVTYSIGPQPYDSKGNPYSSPLSAGTTGSLFFSMEGIYPLYGTTSSITVLTQQTLVSMLTANNIVFSLVAETGGNKQKIDIPNVWTGSPTNRPLVGIQTYNTVSSQWEYQGGTAATSLTYWTTSATTWTINSVVVNYTRYQYNGTDRSSVQARLIF